MEQSKRNCHQQLSYIRKIYRAFRRMHVDYWHINSYFFHQKCSPVPLGGTSRIKLYQEQDSVRKWHWDRILCFYLQEKNQSPNYHYLFKIISIVRSTYNAGKSCRISALNILFLELLEEVVQRCSVKKVFFEIS